MSAIVNGNSGFLVAALLLMAGVNSVHAQSAAVYPSRAIRIVVPPVTIDLLRGEVQWMFGTIMPTLPQIKAGKLRAIAVSGTTRAPTLPEVPPVADTLAGFEATSCYGIFAPAKTPRDIVVKLNGEIVRALGTREKRERLAQDGSVPVGDTPEIFSAFFQGEVAKWAKVIRDVGLRSDL